MIRGEITMYTPHELQFNLKIFELSNYSLNIKFMYFRLFSHIFLSDISMLELTVKIKNKLVN